jgi:hypothetical protein
VLSVTDKTVPITVPVVVLIILPTLISVRNEVPVPVITADPAVVFMVPDLVVFGQAVALQLPEVRLVTLAACVTNVMSTIRKVRESLCILI